MEVDVDRLKLVRTVSRQAEEQTGLIHSASIGGARSKKEGLMRFIALWIPDWPVNSLVIDLPPGAPGAVGHRGKIDVVSFSARKHGVRHGMRIETARYLCPELIIVPRDQEREGRSFDAVIEAFESVMAKVMCMRPGLSWVWATPATRWHGSEEAAATAIVDAVAQQVGVEAFVGVAQGVFAATYAARTQRIVTDQEMPSFLASIPVRYILELLDGKEKEQAAQDIELLATLGVHTCGQLKDLGKGQIYARFGSNADIYWKLSEGHDVFVPPMESA